MTGSSRRGDANASGQALARARLLPLPVFLAVFVGYVMGGPDWLVWLLPPLSFLVGYAGRPTDGER